MMNLDLKGLQLFFYLFLSTVFLSSVTFVECCGFTTHSFVANRALDYFYKSANNGYDKLLLSNRDAVISGAPFPDYLYSCGTDHDAGEAAHWTPFHKAAVEIIRTYPRPWTSELNNFVSFLFGAVSHYIADLNWHGLGNVPSGYGFIQTLGINDFGCNGDLCSDAHTAADTGGEFVASFGTNLDWFAPAKWNVPSKLLVPVFAKLGHNVTTETLDNCKLEFIAGGLAIKYLSSLIYFLETDKAPFLTESYIDHPLGGVDDMAIWTTQMWDRLSDWIENGVPDPLPSISEKHIHRRVSPLISFIKRFSPLIIQSEHFKPLLSNLNDYQNIDLDSLEKEFIQKVSESGYFTDLDQTPRPIKTVFGNSKSESAQDIGSMSVKSVINDITPSAVGYFGSSLAAGDFDGDGLVDSAIGAYGTSALGVPQYGTVSVTLSNNGNNRTISLDGRLFGGIFSRFGFSLAVVDYNLDGLDDLAVSAPLAGWNWTGIQQNVEYRYYGSIFIFYGQKGAVDFGTKANVVINSNSLLLHLGYILNTGDINGDGFDDLISSSPYSKGKDPSGKGIQKGILHVYFSKKPKIAEDQILFLNEFSADAILEGPADFSHFGVDVSVDSLNNLLIISAPGYRSSTSNNLSVGRIIGYKLPIKTNFSDPPAFTITGSIPSAKFGFQAIITGSNLIVSMPSVHTSTSTNSLDGTGSGQVIVYKNVSGLSGDLMWNDTGLGGSLILGNHYDGRFGFHLDSFDFNDDGLNELIVSSPLSNKNYFGVSNHERGSVYIFSGLFINNLVNGSIHESTEKGASISFEGDKPLGRFGSNFLVNKQNKHLWISQPRADVINPVNNLNLEMAGQVTEFTVTI